MTALWMWLLIASVVAWATKVGGLSVPSSWLERTRVRRITTLLPVTMLAGLAAVAVADGGGTWQVDPALILGVAAGATGVATDRVGVLGAFVLGATTTALARLVIGS